MNQSGGGVGWLRPEAAGLAPESLAQAVERRDDEAARRRRVGELLSEQPGEGLVEADQEGPKALPGEPAGHLGGKDRLPAPGRPGDRDPPAAPEGVEDEQLRAFGDEELGRGLGDPVGEERPKGGGRSEEVVDELEGGGVERPAAGAVAGPEVERPADRAGGV